MVAVVGKKIGMSRIYTDTGAVVPVTLIKIYESLVSGFKSHEDRNFNQVTLSYGKDSKTERRISKPVLGFYRKNNLEPHDNMRTFKVGKDVECAVGDIFGINKLEEGALVSVTGISKGKGFAGVMKKYGFGGQPAQHGVSVTHRSLGSTGNRRREAKVNKGKKMPGHMGAEQVTVKNLEVVRVEGDDRIICVKGAVPGYRGAELVIRITNA